MAAMLGTCRAATTIMDNLETVLRHSGTGLHANDADALAFLVAEGPMRPSELIRLTALTRSPATLHKILNRLEVDGYVTRSRHPTDSRGVIFTATDKGKASIMSLWPAIERRVIQDFERHFSSEELAQLADMTARV
jgi:DNA-binding MarR family transcriptional regulator